MKARTRTATRPARERVPVNVADTDPRRPFLVTHNGIQSVVMRISDDSEIGLIFSLNDGSIGDFDFESHEGWTFDRYLTEGESVQIIGG